MISVLLQCTVKVHRLLAANLENKQIQIVMITCRFVRLEIKREIEMIHVCKYFCVALHIRA